MSDSLGRCAVCGKDANVLYPLLSSSPSFCDKHHTPEHTSKFGADFSGPDDFEIPEAGWGEYAPKFSRKTFIWTDKNHIKHKLEDINDSYLSNIINFLKHRIKQIPDIDYDSIADIMTSTEQTVDYWEAVVSFLEKEQARRVHRRKKEIIARKIT